MAKSEGAFSTGTRIRQRRTVIGMRQGELAKHVGISASYLNLIEHNRRRIAGKLLADIAVVLDVDPALLSEDAQSALLQDLRTGAENTGAELDRMADFAGRFPGWAQHLVDKQKRVSELERTVEILSDRLTHDPHLSDALHEVLTVVTAIRSTSGILAGGNDLDAVWQTRFQKNIDEDARRLAESAESLVQYLDGAGQPDQGLSSPGEELDACFASHGWHFPMLETSDMSASQAQALAKDLVTESMDLRSDNTRSRMLRHLLEYRIRVMQMPLDRFLSMAEECGWDPLALAAHFNRPVPEVMQRLAMLPAASPAGGIGLISCDAAGNLNFRKSPEGFSVPRFDGACALWPLFDALARPGEMLLHQVAQSQGRNTDDVPRFAALSFGTQNQPVQLGMPVQRQAYMLLMSKGILSDQVTSVPVVDTGASCRICLQSNCPARREAALLSRQKAADGF
ncbi:short-chain fatty acyl-CoA regulator family protein [Halocynthiibacter sp.]|uniref:short-chain fatty acyl-CoA regulator family protein n=1 Tax=Halocynthiibacter sp. TaxID=1979210 RepID=UPI003C45B7E9